MITVWHTWTVLFFVRGYQHRVVKDAVAARIIYPRPTSLRVIRDRGFDRSDEPCDAVVSWTPPRNVDRNLGLRRRKLFTILAGH